ncbi:CoA ester lyase [Variovorax sp. PCZ-1]|uniref:HpcH/HpaI aldolase/citrate lyase family protein n=1 Tax=Variovorax sp. PCZ-1 TaxID=2835533 RepID=UPI001BCAA280|nr:CoA ester lyase [Variovorax sp. PCZ-1]MBS7806070.1 CoA ester lyase [Variovorax sp. PCZ-1]
MSRIHRPRRVQLAVPASNEKMMAKAALSAADHVFLDLEDAVAPREKVAARAKAVHALTTHDWTNKTRCVRINDIATAWCHDDVIEVVTGAHTHLDTIMLPKANRASDVLFLDTLLGQLEKKLGLTKRIGIEVLIEEVDGLINVDEIARASDRVEALIFGMGDYSASHGVHVQALREDGYYPGDLWAWPRWRIVMAARSVGIHAIDGPYPNLGNERGYADECRKCLALGMWGKWALHPNQIASGMEVFSPKVEDVKRARSMAAAYTEAEKQGLGAIELDGVFVDAATIRVMSNTLSKADLYRM